MIVIFHVDDYRVVYYTIIMAVYFTDIIYIFVIAWLFYRILGGNMRIIAASARISWLTPHAMGSFKS